MSRAAKTGLALAAAVGGAAIAGAAAAAPSVDIRHAAARVVVYPEARADVAVSVQQANPRLPLTITRMGDQVIVDGGLGWRVGSCHSRFGVRGVGVFGIGDIRYDQLPLIIVHAPLDAKIGAGSAVYGVINRSRTLDFANAGCGDWTIANVAGHARISQSGSGDSRVGSVAAADVNVSGSGNVQLQAIGGGLNANVAGSGDIAAASVDGVLNARVAGSGDVKVAAGQAPAINARIAGSGDVTFGGVAGRVSASIAGSGDVRVRTVTGPVSKQVAGSGEVLVGR